MSRLEENDGLAIAASEFPKELEGNPDLFFLHFYSFLDA